MAKINPKATIPVRTHQGAKAIRVNPELQLRRSVMACMLWEDQFYEDGQSIADRISKGIRDVAPEKVASIAVEARERMKLRHVPLLIVREMARIPTHRAFVGSTLARVIQRPDELTEFLAIYWKDGRQSLSAQVKKGLAAAFTKFDAYQLAKYDRAEKVKLKDVLFLTHPKPTNKEQEAIWKQLIDGTLAPPDTWEVGLSAGEDKAETFTRLLKTRKLGALALLRNLRNMQQSGVNTTLVKGALETANVSRVLPFRFLTAARHVPKWEPYIEPALFRCTQGRKKLPGKTILVVDVSGSMYHGSVSKYSEMDRAQVACSLAILVRELCEEVAIYATAGNDGTVIHQTQEVPARRGFALSDVVYKMCDPLGGGGIFLTQCLNYIKPLEKTADRIIVITDEEDCDHDDARSPSKADAFGKHNYLINVASYENGIGYGKWTHIDGFSEAVLDYAGAVETLQ